MSILGNVMGSLAGHGESGGLLQMAGELLQKVGGVQGLKALLIKSGLGEQVKSWIGNGPNLPVSGEQLGGALEAGGLGSFLQDAAQKLGTDQGALQGQLAKVLPEVVDHVTPDGQEPEGSGFDLTSLGGLAGKLFG